MKIKKPLSANKLFCFLLNIVCKVGQLKATI